jgi:hypothetical protein
MSNLAEFEFCYQIRLNLTLNSTKFDHLEQTLCILVANLNNLGLKSTIWANFLVILMALFNKFGQCRPNLTILGQIQRSNLVEFEFRDQIRPQIRNSYSTFLFEFRIISSQVRNSSEIRNY